VKLPAAAAAVGVLLLLLAGCADPAENGGSTPQSPGIAESASTAPGGVQVLEVMAGPGVRFMQTDLHAHVGMVKIVLTTSGGLAHDLTFTDGPQGGTSEISSGSTSVTLRFSTPGVYHFICTVHERMRGTLTIS
jgi:plastocyanin